LQPGDGDCKLSVINVDGSCNICGYNNLNSKVNVDMKKVKSLSPGKRAKNKEKTRIGILFCKYRKTLKQLEGISIYL